MQIHPMLFFLALDINIKMYHWMTKSYARHKASDELHEKMLALGDKFVEVYIAKYQRPKQPFNKKDLSAMVLHSLNDSSVETYLDDCVQYLMKGMMSYISVDKDVDLINIRDDLVTEIMQAKYLFTLH
jgi:hypothetical protein